MHLGNGLWLHSVPPPGSGIILAYILNTMENYNITALDRDDPLMYHRLVEAYKYGYAYRSKLGDPFDTNITTVVNHVRYSKPIIEILYQIRYVYLQFSFSKKISHMFYAPWKF